MDCRDGFEASLAQSLRRCRQGHERLGDAPSHEARQQQTGREECRHARGQQAQRPVQIRRQRTAGNADRHGPARGRRPGVERQHRHAFERRGFNDALRARRQRAQERRHCRLAHELLRRMRAGGNGAQDIDDAGDPFGRQALRLEQGVESLRCDPHAQRVGDAAIDAHRHVDADDGALEHAADHDAGDDGAARVENGSHARGIGAPGQGRPIADDGVDQLLPGSVAHQDVGDESGRRDRFARLVVKGGQVTGRQQGRGCQYLADGLGAQELAVHGLGQGTSRLQRAGLQLPLPLAVLLHQQDHAAQQPGQHARHHQQYEQGAYAPARSLRRLVPDHDSTWHAQHRGGLGCQGHLPHPRAGQSFTEKSTPGSEPLAQDGGACGGRESFATLMPQECHARAALQDGYA